MSDFLKSYDGAKQDCPKCGIEIYCRKNYSSRKLQWQNEDGISHYGHDGYDFFCKDPDEYPAKEEGVEKECKECGTWIYCRLKKYKNYPDTLQWQNEDGKSHYRYVRNKEFECNVK